MILVSALFAIPDFFVEILTLDIFGWLAAAPLACFCLMLIYKMLGGGRV